MWAFDHCLRLVGTVHTSHQTGWLKDQGLPRWCCGWSGDPETARRAAWLCEQNHQFPPYVLTLFVAWTQRKALLAQWGGQVTGDLTPLDIEVLQDQVATLDRDYGRRFPKPLQGGAPFNVAETTSIPYLSDIPINVAETTSIPYLSDIPINVAETTSIPYLSDIPINVAETTSIPYLSDIPRQAA